MSSCWQVLGTDSTDDVREIKRAYAKLLKLNKPDEDPAGFEQLRAAYTTALDLAKAAATRNSPVAENVAPTEAGSIDINLKVDWPNEGGQAEVRVEPQEQSLTGSELGDLETLRAAVDELLDDPVKMFLPDAWEFLGAAVYFGSEPFRIKLGAQVLTQVAQHNRKYRSKRNKIRRIDRRIAEELNNAFLWTVIPEEYLAVVNEDDMLAIIQLIDYSRSVQPGTAYGGQVPSSPQRSVFRFTGVRIAAAVAFVLLTVFVATIGNRSSDTPSVPPYDSLYFLGHFEDIHRDLKETGTLNTSDPDASLLAWKTVLDTSPIRAQETPSEHRHVLNIFARPTERFLRREGDFRKEIQWLDVKLPETSYSISMLFEREPADPNGIFKTVVGDERDRLFSMLNKLEKMATSVHESVEQTRQQVNTALAASRLSPSARGRVLSMWEDIFGRYLYEHRQRVFERRLEYLTAYRAYATYIEEDVPADIVRDPNFHPIDVQTFGQLYRLRSNVERYR